MEGGQQRVPCPVPQLPATTSPAEGNELEVGVAKRGKNRNHCLQWKYFGGRMYQVCLGVREKLLWECCSTALERSGTGMLTLGSGQHFGEGEFLL